MVNTDYKYKITDQNTLTACLTTITKELNIFFNKKFRTVAINTYTIR